MNIAKTLSLVHLILNYFSLKLKDITLLFTQNLFFSFFYTQFYILYAHFYIHNVVLTLPSVVKLDVKNCNVVLTLSKIVHVQHRNKKR